MEGIAPLVSLRRIPGWLGILTILSLTVLQLRGAKRWVHYEGERGK